MLNGLPGGKKHGAVADSVASNCDYAGSVRRAIDSKNRLRRHNVLLENYKIFHNLLAFDLRPLRSISEMLCSTRTKKVSDSR